MGDGFVQLLLHFLLYFLLEGVLVRGLGLEGGAVGPAGHLVGEGEMTRLDLGTGRAVGVGGRSSRRRAFGESFLGESAGLVLEEDVAEPLGGTVDGLDAGEVLSGLEEGGEGGGVEQVVFTQQLLLFEQQTLLLLLLQDQPAQQLLRVLLLPFGQLVREQQSLRLF